MKDKKSYSKVHKKNLNRMFPLFLGGAFLIIMVTTIIMVTSKNPSNNKSLNQTKEEDSTATGDKQMLAVLEEIDSDGGTMTLLGIEDGKEVILSFNGGTNIIDKYKKIISASQLTLGDMVDVSYNKEENKMVKLQISDRAWEYQGVTKWSINDTNDVFQIVDQKYKLPDYLVIMRKDEQLELSDLNEIDQLTVKGYKNEIYSIIVTKSHGTLAFEDYKDFVGGTAYIGDSDILEVVDNMIITVPEGSYDVTLEHGSLKGTKKVEVAPDEDVILNMGEFKKPLMKTCLVTFDISPEGADLYVDDKLQSYDEPVVIETGKHTIRVELGGFDSYIGEADIKGSSETISIDLAQAKGGNSTETKGTKNTTETNGTTTNNNTTTTPNNNTTGSNTTDTSKNSTETKQIESANYIHINTPVGASVYMGGVYKGTVPVSFPKETGTQYITLIKTGYITETNSVEIKNDKKDVTLNFDMTKRK